MKNLFKILAFLMPFFAVSCVEDLVNPNEGLDRNETVTLTLHTGAPTKTMLVDDRYVRWEEGDMVDINNELYTVRLDESDSTIAYVDNVTVADEYFAHYSGSWYWYGENEVYFDLPVSQLYRPDSFGQFANQMMAYSTTPELYFRNAASVLKLGLKGNGERVSRVTVTGNDNEDMSGVYVVPFDEFKEIEKYPGLQTDTLYYRNKYVQLRAYGELELSGTPQYVYMVVPPQTFAKGITVVVEDVDGRVCYQSTDKTLTTNRSDILQMADFTFNAAEALAVSDIVPGAVNVEYKVKAKPGQIRAAVVFKEIWDQYIADNGEEYADAVATAIINGFGKYYTVPESGELEINCMQAYNYSSLVYLTADTEYKLLVSYANGPSIGTAIVNDFKTTEAAGDVPTITVEKEVGQDNYTLKVLVSENAANVVFINGTKADVDALLAEGRTVDQILSLYGGAINDEGLAAAKTEGLPYTRTGLTSDTEYTVLIRTANATGAQTVQRIDVRTANIFGVEGEWKTLTETAEMTCGLVNPWGVYDFYLKNLAVEKLGDHDIFRILNFGSALNSFVEGFVETSAEASYFYVDARDAAAVVVPYDLNKIITVPNGEVCYFSTVQVAAEGYSYGSYDKSTGVVSLGDIAMMLGDTAYILGNTSVLYLAGGPGAVLSGWGVVGLFNNWGNADETGVTVADFPMELDETGKYLVAKSIELPAGEFKMRQYGQWGYGNVGLPNAPGSVQADYVYDIVNGNDAFDMQIAAGTYDLWLDLANNKLYVMTAGKDISEAQPGTPGEFVTPEPEPQGWYLVGSFNEWVCADSTYKMTETESYYVYNNIKFEADVEMKFNVGEWSVNRGGNFALNTASEAYQDGPDFMVPAGTYDIFMTKDAAYVYFMEKGKAPEDLYVEISIPDVSAQARGAYVKTSGTVVASYARGIMISDGKYNALVFDASGSLSGYLAGDVVEVRAQIQKYAGMLQLQNATVTHTGSASVELPAPVVYTAENINDLVGGTTPVYIEYEGTLVVSGNYYNVEIEGAVNSAGTAVKGSVAYPMGAIKELLDANNGAKVKVTGYYVGMTGSNVYVNTMATAVEVLEAVEVAPVEITVADFLNAPEGDTWYQLTGTISNVKSSTYGNFDLVDGTGSVYVYGLTATKVDSNDKSYANLGLKAGDIVTLVGKRASYNGTPQVGGPAYYISHVVGEAPVIPDPVAVTIADFLNAPEDNQPYILTGKISNLANTTYGNFDLVDETGSVYVYGLTAAKAESNDKSFSTLGLKEGDILTLIGTRASYNGVAQVGGPAYYVSHEVGETPEVPPTDSTVTSSAIVLTFPDENSANNSVGSYTADWVARTGNYEINISGFNNNNNGWSYIKCGRKNYDSVASITNATSMPKLSSVGITVDAYKTVDKVNSILLAVYSDAGCTEVLAENIAPSEGLVTGDLTFAVPAEIQAEGLYYKLVFDCASASSNGVVQVSKVSYFVAE